jgi:uncharacterized protein (TIGR02996 family)
MDEEEALLQAIADEPDDDGPRLIFADWLEERADPRAELIRVQCTLERLGPADPRRWRLEARARAILHEHEWMWLGAVRGALKQWRFRRGLLEEVTITAGRFLQHAAALCRLGPLCELKLHSASGRTARLAACPYLTRPAVVNLSHNFLTDVAAAELAGSPCLRRLRALRLAHNFIRGQGAQVLAASPHLAGLRQLDLRGNPLNQAGREALRAAFGDRVTF